MEMRDARGAETPIREIASTFSAADTVHGLQGARDKIQWSSGTMKNETAETMLGHANVLVAVERRYSSYRTRVRVKS